MSPRTRKAGAAPSAPDDTETNWVYKLGRPNSRPRGDDFKFRLNVIGATVADVVTCVGGWLADRAMMGWDVTVLITEPQPDFGALHILGVTPLDFDSVLNSGTRLPLCDGVSASADLYFSEARVRRHVRHRLHRRESEFTLWGNHRQTKSVENADGASDLVVIEHQLSFAARSFKAQAVAAALDSWPAVDVGATEEFRDGRFRDRFRQSPLRAIENPDPGTP